MEDAKNQGVLVPSSPISASGMTYLSGVGLFDWATSPLMDDLL